MQLFMFPYSLFLNRTSQGVLKRLIKRIIGRNLKSIRQSRKLTQLKVATDLGMTGTALSNYENNKRKHDEDVIRSFADYYGVSITEIIEDKQSNNQKIPSLKRRD